MRFLSGIILLVSLVSCRSLLMRKYGFNRTPAFASRAACIQDLVQRKHLPASCLLVPDSSDLEPFLFSVAQSQDVVYYGSFLNDSTALKRSADLRSNTSCIGKLLADIDAAMDTGTGAAMDTDIAAVTNRINTSSGTDAGARSSIPFPERPILEKRDFNRFHFLNAVDGSPYRIEDAPRPVTIFLLYSYGTGNYFDAFYTAVLHAVAEHRQHAALKIIIIDPLPRQ